MLRYFPEPFPEELFLSIVARYGEHLRLWRRQQVQEQLFGRGNIAVGVELPRAVGVLVGRLPANNRLSVDHFIYRHTLLPLYLPFLTSSLRADAKGAMCGEQVRDVLAILGRNVKVRTPDWLRFCPICWKQDQMMFGEVFWHRSHQVAGVEVCAKHRVFLETSNAPRQVPASRYTLNTAKAFYSDVSSRVVEAANTKHRSLLDIACDVEWLLEKNDFFPDPELLQSRYIELLREEKFTTTGKKIHYSLLKDVIRNRFSDAMLESLNCDLPEYGDCQWIKRLVRGNASVLKHPLHHVIFARTLGCSIETIFESLRETSPAIFGLGPWPCYNPVCSKQQQRTIKFYKVRYGGNGDKIHGVFRCPNCGYMYSANGIIDSAAHPFSMTRCHDRGKMWRRELKKLWNKGNSTLDQIAELLGSSTSEIINFAVQQGLSLHTCDDTDKSPVLVDSALKRFEARVEFVQKRRSLWLELRKQHPEASIKQLERLPNSPFRWLMSDDRAWLLENRPAVRRRGRNLGDCYTLEDWVSRDREYSLQVKRAVSALKSKPGRPIRISISAICRAASIEFAESSKLQNALTNSGHTVRIRAVRASQLTTPDVVKNLPQTKLILQQVVESAVEFARRRLLWAVEECREKSISFTRYKLAAMAGVRTLANKNVHRAESIALRTLISDLCRGPKQDESSSQNL